MRSFSRQFMLYIPLSAPPGSVTPSARGLTGVGMGFSCRGMAGDLQVGLGFRPGFGQQPDAVPEPAPEKQPPQPVDAVADDADDPARPTARAAMGGSQFLGWCPEAARSNSPVIGVFHPGAIGQGQQRRHRQHQPMARNARRVGPPGLIPLPTQALERLEAQLDPEAQRIPTGSGPPPVEGRSG